MTGKREHHFASLSGTQMLMYEIVHKENKLPISHKVVSIHQEVVNETYPGCTHQPFYLLCLQNNGKITLDYLYHLWPKLKTVSLREKKSKSLEKNVINRDSAHTRRLNSSSLSRKN